MKKAVVVFAVMILSMSMLTGCLPMAILENALEEADAVKEFEIDGYGITMTAPGEWEEEEESNFDMQIHDERTYFSVYAYYFIDLAKADTPESIYELQNEDLFSKRDNVEIVEDPVTYSSNGKTITRTLYSAEKEGDKFYYVSCLITFDDNDEVFAWALVSAQPSVIMSNMDTYIEMIDSMQAGMDENI